MSSSYGISLFKAESVDDLTTEQFKVLVLALEHFNKTVDKTMSAGVGQESGERTTYRIVTKDYGK